MIQHGVPCSPSHSASSIYPGKDVVRRARVARSAGLHTLEWANSVGGAAGGAKQFDDFGMGLTWRGCKVFVGPKKANIRGKTANIRDWTRGGSSPQKVDREHGSGECRQEERPLQALVVQYELYEFRGSNLHKRIRQAGVRCLPAGLRLWGIGLGRLGSTESISKGKTEGEGGGV